MLSPEPRNAAGPQHSIACDCLHVTDVTALRKALKSRLKSLWSGLPCLDGLCADPSAICWWADAQASSGWRSSTLAQQENPRPGPDNARMQSSQSQNLAKLRALICNHNVPLLSHMAASANTVIHALQVVQAAHASKLVKTWRAPRQCMISSDVVFNSKTHYCDHLLARELYSSRDACALRSGSQRGQAA